MLLIEMIKRFNSLSKMNRIGPDIPATHWMLHYRSTMVKLCRKKFLYFGDGAEFRPYSYALGCSNISIGRRVVVRPGSTISAANYENGTGVIIEDDVLLGPSVSIFVTKHRFEEPDVLISDQGYHKSEEVIIKEGAWIGANVTILPGVTIGKNSVVGAGSVVMNSIPDRLLAAGNPARIVREL